MGKTYRKNYPGVPVMDADHPWKHLDTPGRSFKKKYRRREKLKQNAELRDNGEVETVRKNCVNWEYW